MVSHLSTVNLNNQLARKTEVSGMSTWTLIENASVRISSCLSYLFDDVIGDILFKTNFRLSENNCTRLNKLDFPFWGKLKDAIRRINNHMRDWRNLQNYLFLFEWLRDCLISWIYGTVDLWYKQQQRAMIHCTRV